MADSSKEVVDSAEKFKQFPKSQKPELITHIVFKGIDVDAATIVSGISRCPALESIRFEKIQIAKKAGKSLFKKRVHLPKLKEFYYEQVKAKLDSRDELEEYLDSFDVKTILFFDKKPDRTWELEHIWDLKIDITVIIDGWKILKIDHQESAFMSMLPSSDSILKNVSRDLKKLSLYDCEIADDLHVPTNELTSLNLYEVIMQNPQAVIDKCAHLEELCIYDEKDEDDVEDDKDQKPEDDDDDEDDDDEDDDDDDEDIAEEEEDDWTTIDMSTLPSTLKRIALGRTKLLSKTKKSAPAPTNAFNLNVLCLDNCKLEPDVHKMIKSKKVLLNDCEPVPTATVLKRQVDASEWILMNGFDWEAKDTNKKKMNELVKGSASGVLYSNEEKFVLEKGSDGKWKGSKFEDKDSKLHQFRYFKWDDFCTEETSDNWYIVDVK